MTTSPWSRNSRIALIKIQDEARPWILPTRMKSCTRLLESDDLDNAKSTAPERLRFSWGCTAHQDFVEDFKQGRILPAADFAFWILPSTRFETETSKNSGDKASNPLTTALLSFSSTSPHDRFWILDSGVTREMPMVVAICWSCCAATGPPSRGGGTVVAA